MEKYMEFNIRLESYFEIKDSEIFGGAGSIGYSSTAVEFSQIDYNKPNLFNNKEIMEEYISYQIEKMAKVMNVPAECVRLISKEEFDKNTEEE